MYGRDKNNKANDILGKIKGLTKKAIYEQIKTGSIPKETLLNRCLVLIEAIQSITSVTARQRNRALKEAWDVYLLLTDFTGPERLDYDSTREVGLHLVDKNSIVVDYELPPVFRGGLGFAQVSWKHSFHGQVGKGSVWGNQYWQPERAKRNGKKSLADTDYWAVKKKQP
jgi:hypothetical protein